MKFSRRQAWIYLSKIFLDFRVTYSGEVPNILSSQNDRLVTNNLIVIGRRYICFELRRLTIVFLFFLFLLCNNSNYIKCYNIQNFNKNLSAVEIRYLYIFLQKYLIILFLEIGFCKVQLPDKIFHCRNNLSNTAYTYFTNEKMNNQIPYR